MAVLNFNKYTVKAWHIIQNPFKHTRYSVQKCILKVAPAYFQRAPFLLLYANTSETKATYNILSTFLESSETTSVLSFEISSTEGVERTGLVGEILNWD